MVGSQTPARTVRLAPSTAPHLAALPGRPSRPAQVERATRIVEAVLGGLQQNLGAAEARHVDTVLDLRRQLEVGRRPPRSPGGRQGGDLMVTFQNGETDWVQVLAGNVL